MPRSPFSVLTRPSLKYLKIPDDRVMKPGETWVEVLPSGNKQFVRKRRERSDRQSVSLIDVFGSFRKAFSGESSRKMGWFCPSHRRPAYVYELTTKTSPEADSKSKYPHDTRQGRVATTVQQTCSSCGKFRSPNWQARNPLMKGEPPRSSICKRCRNMRTSSEEYEPKARRRRRKNHQRERYTESTEDYSSQESRGAPRRYRSDSRETKKRRLRRPSSRDNIRIVIANECGAQERRKREPTRSSSEAGIRFIHRTEYIDSEERSHPCSRQSSFSSCQFIDLPKRLRSHSELRSSSHLHVDEMERPRFRSRPRSLSRSQYLDELDEPRYRSRRRSSSHAHFVDDLDEPRYRSGRRSTSHAHFVDELDEPRFTSRPRSLRSRRPIYFDGSPETDAANDTDTPVCTSFPKRPAWRAIENGSDTKLIEEVVIPHHRPGSSAERLAQRAIEDDNDAELVEEFVMPHHHPSSESLIAEVGAPYVTEHEYFDSSPGPKPGQTYYQPVSERPLMYEPRSDETLRPPRSAHQVEVSDDAEEPTNYHSTYKEAEDMKSDTVPSALRAESKEPNLERIDPEPKIPQRERRRRFRDTDLISNSSDDDPPIPIPFNYRYVYKSSPSNHYSSNLADTPPTSEDTPPGGPSGYQYAPPPTVHRSYYSTPISESMPYRPPLYQYATVEGTEREPARKMNGQGEESYRPKAYYGVKGVASDRPRGNSNEQDECYEPGSYYVPTEVAEDEHPGYVSRQTEEKDGSGSYYVPTEVPEDEHPGYVSGRVEENCGPGSYYVPTELPWQQTPRHSDGQADESYSPVTHHGANGVPKPLLPEQKDELYYRWMR
ncbi:serine arginine-rich splicing factor [Mycoblastus sanguinarius]|nr:serine arginine-rich splicing factor [Mycoblastus sanguinarius]